MIKPEKIKTGDCIGIVAPASSFDKVNFKKGVHVLRNLGFKVRYEKSIFNKCWSEPGHDRQRAMQINRMFADPEIKAIMCAKAGYGSQEVISFLDPQVLHDNPKVFVGYSDITILLLYLQHVAGMVVFHGPVVSGEFFEGMNADTIDSFNRILGSVEPFGGVSCEELNFLIKGNASGPLVGGNLSLILKSIGTEYEINVDNKILFLEEIDETMDEIIVGLNRLRENNKLEKIRGIVWGRMTNCYEDEDKFVHSISAFFKDCPYPVLYGLPSGHTEDMAHAHISLPLGVTVKINAGKPYFEIMEGAVRA